MANGNIDITLRPLRFAFLVPPDDKKALLEAININTLLWGGIYNPIIPIYDSVPEIWRDKYFREEKIDKILSGYIEAFDPDIIVKLGGIDQINFEVGNRKIIDSSELIDRNINIYGCNILEISDYILGNAGPQYEKMIIPTFDVQNELFLSAAFGKLAFENEKSLLKGTVQNFLESPKHLINEFYKWHTARNNYVLFLNTFNIKMFSKNGVHDNYFYLLNQENYSDIIDFWNLRATGINIWPVPSNFSDDDIKKYADFACKAYVPDFFTDNVRCHVFIIKSRSILDDKILKHVAGLFKPYYNSISPQVDVGIQPFFPCINKGNNNFSRFEVDSKNQSFSDYHSSINITPLLPCFINRYSEYRPIYCSNDLKLNIHHDDFLVPEVLPRSLNTYGLSFFSSFDNRYLVKNSGDISYFVNRLDSEIEMKIPSSESIFLNWFRVRDWNCDFSSAGKSAKQMLKQVGTLHKVSVLAKSDLIKLLTDVSETSCNAESLNGKLNRIYNHENNCKNELLGKIFKNYNSRDSKNFNPTVIIQDLIKMNIIKLGVEMQCPHCSKRGWHSLNSFDYEVQCPNCLDKFEIPSHSPQDIKWSYRVIGPFSDIKKSDGALSVLLTLRFFSSILELKTTPIIGTILRNKDEKIKFEVDLAMFVKNDMHSEENHYDTLFVECKSFNDFTQDDFSRMETVVNYFPGVTIVFAKLGSNLSPKEVELLENFVDLSRNRFKQTKLYSDVIILTGEELFLNKTILTLSLNDQPEFLKRRLYWQNISPLCEWTQKKYLKIQPWND